MVNKRDTDDIIGTLESLAGFSTRHQCLDYCPGDRQCRDRDSHTQYGSYLAAGRFATGGHAVDKPAQYVKQYRAATLAGAGSEPRATEYLEEGQHAGPGFF